jgi:hypothetical protein
MILEGLLISSEILGSERQASLNKNSSPNSSSIIGLIKTSLIRN